MKGFIGIGPPHEPVFRGSWILMHQNTIMNDMHRQESLQSSARNHQLAVEFMACHFQYHHHHHHHHHQQRKRKRGFMEVSLFAYLDVINEDSEQVSFCFLLIHDWLFSC